MVGQKYRNHGYTDLPGASPAMPAPRKCIISLSIKSLLVLRKVEYFCADMPYLLAYQCITFIIPSNSHDILTRQVHRCVS